jgi:hypothetical protein
VKSIEAICEDEEQIQLAINIFVEWLGHVVRMNETRSVKKIFEGKLEGRRGRGRPTLRWINDVKDNRRKLSVKRWRKKVLERE